MHKVALNIVLIGPMGAGKTSIGKAFAKSIGWEFFDSDQIIEERTGADLLWIYDLEGEEGFHVREQKIIAELLQKKHIVLATGGNTVAINKNRELISTNNIVIYLRTSLADQLIRTSYSKKRPISAEITQRTLDLKKLRQEYEPLYEQLADIVCDTDNKTTRNVITELMTLIKQKFNLCT
jgi:shikimate kinase